MKEHFFEKRMISTQKTNSDKKHNKKEIKNVIQNLIKKREMH